MGICIGAALQLRRTWNLKGGSYTGDFERNVNVGSSNGPSLSLRDSMKGTWRKGSFIGDPKIYVNYGSGNGRLLPQGHFWGTWGGALILGPLREKNTYL
jgi:hypothetical protein